MGGDDGARCVVRLQAYITRDVRWNQTLQLHRQLEKQRLARDGDGASGDEDASGASGPLSCGSLSLEAVLRGRRLPIKLRFDDDDDGGLRRVAAADQPGMLAVELEVDLMADCCSRERTDEGAAGPADEAEAIPLPGQLRVNLWCSLSGPPDGDSEGEQEALSASGGRSASRTPPQTAVGLPDLLVASVQVRIIHHARPLKR